MLYGLFDVDQRDVTAGASYDNGRPQGHWRMSSYEYGADGRRDARDPTSGGRMPSSAVDPRGYVVPARDDRGASTSSSQPDLLRSYDRPTHPSRPPAVQTPRRSGNC